MIILLDWAYTTCSVVFAALNLVHIFLCLCIQIGFILL